MTKFSIPKISDETLKKYEHIKPVVSDGKLKFYLRDCDPRVQSFEKKEIAKNLVKKTSIQTIHKYGYHGFFTYCAADVIAQIPEDLLEDAVAFEVFGPNTAEDLAKNLDAFNAGFHIAKTVIYTQGKSSREKKPTLTEFQRMDFESRLEYTDVLVECGSYNEQHQLWCIWYDNPSPRFKEKPYKSWEQIGSGNMLTIGYVGEMPVCICFYWAFIDDKIVGFYHPTSQVVDYEKIDNWISLRYKNKKTDAGNFSLVVN